MLGPETQGRHLQAKSWRTLPTLRQPFDPHELTEDLRRTKQPKKKALHFCRAFAFLAPKLDSNNALQALSSNA
jgi:hypothetical protein